jgi:predicted nucleic acid-binding protein
VQETLAAFKVCVADHSVLRSALTSKITDFEDAVQEASARENGLDAIVTRNLKDYASSGILVLTPAELLKKLPSKPANP